MKITQLHIYLFLFYEATESLTNKLVTLGADVIITCDLDIKNIYWYKQNCPDPPVLILRTYSETYAGGDIFEPKYSVKTNSSLFIRNISTDELAVYYCVKTSEPQKISNGTKLYISVLQNNVTGYRNQTESNDASQYQIPWKTLTIMFALLSVLLIIAVIGLAKICLDMRTSTNTSGKPQCASAAQNTDDQQYTICMLELISPSTLEDTGLVRMTPNTLFFSQ